MMLDPGSFAGNNSSPMPERGPDPIMRTSLAILFSDTASCFSAPWLSTMASCAAKASNLLSAVTNGCPVEAAMCWATSTSYPSGVLMPVPTAVPPNANCSRWARCFARPSTQSPVGT